MSIHLLNNISHKKSNKLLLLKYLQHYNENDIKHIIYEMTYDMKINQKSLKDVFDTLKHSKLGLDHESFIPISKKIEETDTFMNKPFDVEEGVNECGKCKSKRTISYSKQTRSSDEGATCFVYCIDCKHRYSMNS